MKIVLFYPPNNEEYGVFENAQPLDYPLGLCYIASVLEKRGHEVRIFDLDHDKKYNGIKSAASIITEEKPDIVGISCLTYNRKNAFRLAKIAKSVSSDIKVFMGGANHTKRDFRMGTFVLSGRSPETFTRRAFNYLLRRC